MRARFLEVSVLDRGEEKLDWNFHS
jgi:hypothetical protein